MTDEEILKRLGEIEGIVLPGHQWCSHCDNELKPWNPLTDDAQCMALIKKRRVEIERGWAAIVHPHFAVHESLNHAVCLVIIEAHK